MNSNNSTQPNVKLNVIDDFGKLHVWPNQLHRIWDFCESGGNIFAFISAFRSHRSLAMNRKVNSELIRDVIAAKLGLWILAGYWLEEESDQQNKVREDVVFISPRGSTWYGGKNTGQLFKAFIRQMCDKYDLDGSLYKIDSPVDAPMILYKHKDAVRGRRVIVGREKNLGRFFYDKMDKDYSRLHGYNKKFVFEGIYRRNPHSFGDALAVGLKFDDMSL
ncbi:MAG: hypothetical protein JEZ07_18745 [Phycisphaerae bacterium]|nr:hypothetical protein [Phycisphaerae bacterium]